MPARPILVWFRRDLRRSDHAALTAACEAGGPVIPVFICDETVEDMGAAPKWRLGLSVDRLDRDLRAAGSRLILRRGPALDVLRTLVAETGAGAVHWTRTYDPQAIARDTDVKAGLKDDGTEARSFPGHVLFEPWTVETKQGGFYKVYSPFWKAVKSRDVAGLLPAPSMPAPESWPDSDRLEDWHLGEAMRRGAGVVGDFVTVGEDAAQDRLDGFIEDRIAGYSEGRDLPAEDRTSRLSENLAWGEISPARLWHAGMRAREDDSGRGPETFLKEVVWRDFAYHLAYHTPRITTDNWREEWEAFPWKTDERLKEIRAWKRARTGIPFVDAALREMYVTGHMHNRARMIVASYLTKHLMFHWKVGMDWFADCLIDWDPASNAMGWQWTAGSGPDAAPYFRVFNPITQREKFDPRRVYVDRWIAEGRARPDPLALRYFEAVPESWGLSPEDAYPDPVVTAEDGRRAALEAYEGRSF